MRTFQVYLLAFATVASGGVMDGLPRHVSEFIPPDKEGSAEYAVPTTPPPHSAVAIAIGVADALSQQADPDGNYLKTYELFQAALNVMVAASNDSPATRCCRADEPGRLSRIFQVIKGERKCTHPDCSACGGLPPDVRDPAQVRESAPSKKTRIGRLAAAAAWDHRHHVTFHLCSGAGPERARGMAAEVLVSLEHENLGGHRESLRFMELDFSTGEVVLVAATPENFTNDKFSEQLGAELGSLFGDALAKPPQEHPAPNLLGRGARAGEQVQESQS